MNKLHLVLGMFLVNCATARADDPDPQIVLNEAQDLTRQGRFEEALQKFVWFHENALRIDRGMSGVRHSFALSYWIKLGEVYPKARETLVAIRDKAVDAFRAGKGTTELFSDVASINDYLNQGSRTIELFKSIDADNPELAQYCYFYVETTLAEAHEYKLCSKYIPNAPQRFQTTIHGYKLMLKI